MIDARRHVRTRFVVSCFTLAAAVPQPSSTSNTPALFDAYLREYRARYPEAAGGPVTGLFDNSRIAYRQWEHKQAQYLSRLRRLSPPRHLTSSDATTLALLQEHLEASKDFEVCHRELWNVSPVTGWLSDYRRYAAQASGGNEARRSATLARWRKLRAFIDTEIVNLRAGQKQGYSAPRVLVSAIIVQLDRVIALPIRESPFYAAALADADSAFTGALESLVRDDINPAIRRYREYLSNDYLKRARTTVGVAGNPRGQQCFRALARRSALDGA